MKEIVQEGQQIAVVPTNMGAIELASIMEVEAAKRALVKKYINAHMVSGVDFGTIQIGGKQSKPSLFKPGSEKFLSLFRLTARFEKDADTYEMSGSEPGTFAYKCLLYASDRTVVGEGRGVSKLSEKSNWTINNAVKIAEKRAQIDAVLRTGALSDFFTQDLEDMVATTPVFKPTTYGSRAAEDYPEPEESVHETVHVVDDPEGKQFLSQEEIAETVKADIKFNLKILKKLPTPASILKLTGLKMVPENYIAIREKLGQMVEDRVV